MVAYARGSPCRQPSCPGGPIAAGARCLSLLKVVNTGAPKIPHHESWSPGDACTKPRRAFNSLLEKEPKSGKALARPARPDLRGISSGRHPNRTSPPVLPHAALGYYDNGSAGCPRPRKRVDGGGIHGAAHLLGRRAPAFEPRGRPPRASKKRVVVVEASTTRATSGADFVSTHRNARTPSFAVGAGQSQSGRSSPPPPRRRRSVACPRRLAKS